MRGSLCTNPIGVDALFILIYYGNKYNMHWAMLCNYEPTPLDISDALTFPLFLNERSPPTLNTPMSIKPVHFYESSALI